MRKIVFAFVIIFSIVVTSGSNTAVAPQIKEQPTHQANRESATKTASAPRKYQPRYQIVDIHPTNYGERYATDIHGKPVNNSLLIVLHETTNSAQSAINTFKTPHPNDENQVSYHTLIALDGTIMYLLPFAKRAFGAGNSAFVGSNGIETVQTNPELASSVNNFVYHVSLETPTEAWGKPYQSSHSGYTESQYESLAWLLAQSNVPDSRITTHKEVDRSGIRIDPRSFDFEKFFNLLHAYQKQLE